jgi:hypothetical protein
MEVALVSGMEVVREMTTGFQVRKNAKKSVWSRQAGVSTVHFSQHLNS